MCVVVNAYVPFSSFLKSCTSHPLVRTHFFIPPLFLATIVFTHVFPPSSCVWSPSCLVSYPCLWPRGDHIFLGEVVEGCVSKSTIRFLCPEGRLPSHAPYPPVCPTTTLLSIPRSFLGWQVVYLILASKRFGSFSRFSIPTK